jgi:regulator of CtrA degradation
MQAQMAHFTRTYDEALDLIVEARNYMVHLRPASRRPRSSDANSSETLRLSCEALRVTSRLTQVMAWLMLQRAVQDGEISPDEACAEQNRLSGQSVCLDDSTGEDREIPAGLRSLLNRSLHLYQRIARLEEMVVARVLH